MKDITLKIDGNLLENLHPPDSLTLTTEVDGQTIMVRIATDEIDVLDPAEPGEILVYVERQGDGFAVEMEAGDGLRIEEWYFEGEEKSPTRAIQETAPPKAKGFDWVRNGPPLVVGMMVLGGIGALTQPRPWSLVFGFMLAIPLLFILVYRVVTFLGWCFK